MSGRKKTERRATLLMMIVGLLATLFLIITTYITLARFDKLTLLSVEKARTGQQVLDSVNVVALSEMAQAWTDAEGKVLAGGRTVNPTGTVGPVAPDYSAEDIPGYRGSRYLAGIEPVRDWDPTHVVQPVNQFGELTVYKHTVSSFAKANPTGAVRHFPFHPQVMGYGIADPDAAGRGLMLESDSDNDITFSNDSDLSKNDVARNARQAFMDGDADGVSDSAFAETASLTDVANAVAEVIVRAPDGDFKPNAIGNPLTDAQAQQWLRFNDQARYEVATKIISNGGMVALASPGNYLGPGKVWNRQFVTEMFNWVRFQGGNGLPSDTLLSYNSVWANTNFQQLAASAAVVEPFLRHRGGLLSTFGEQAQTGIPSVLENWLQYFPHTFQPVYPSQMKPDLTQRFNLTSIVQNGQGPLPNEWDAWKGAITVNTTDFNQAWPNQVSAPPGYARRHLLTAISNSDELARKVDPTIPTPPTVVGDPNSRGLGLYPGQLKFYLGDITTQAFMDGVFKADPFTDHNNKNQPGGKRVIARLASYYYEMLRDYEGWQDPGYNVSDLTNEPSQTKSEALTRHQQALMLAVNTVAFAAPRAGLGSKHRGFIAPVWYDDDENGDGSVIRRYVGYAPQPFITQVVAHCEEGAPGHIALGVELFYPDDPGPDVLPTDSKFDNPNDSFALDLGQFGISMTGPTAPGDPPPVIRRLGDVLAQRLTGRNFVTVSVDDGSNTSMRTHCEGHITDLTVHTYPVSGMDRKIDVTLWRSDRGTPAEHWYVVDRLTTGDEQNGHIPDNDANQEPPTEQCWVTNYYRDTTVEPYLGGDWNGDGVVDTRARWRVVTDLRSGQKAVDDPNAPNDPNDPDPCAHIPFDTWGNTLGQGDEVAGLVQRAPSVPLYTMNGALQSVVVHGAYRPVSFPTVGFMLFIPRFSHVDSKPMSHVLRQQWEGTSRTNPPSGTPYNAVGGIYPADFGHMWIFDNHQQVKAGSYFSKDPQDLTAGPKDAQLPWGLLVFDYFSTLDRNADLYGDGDGDGRPDIDPLRVPGRININTAPWYVLAGLPVLNPGGINQAADIHHSVSPAFWSEKSGVLVGGLPHVLPDGADLWRFADPAVSGSDSLLYRDTINSTAGWYRLGPYLAEAVASYRDRIRYVSDTYTGLKGADQRNPTQTLAQYLANPYQYRNEAGGGAFGGFAYGAIRRAGSQYGFLSLGELVNVSGFDSAVRTSPGTYWPLGASSTQPQATPPDFFKAVSLMALVDTHFLTTRSNTFTVYTTVTDKQRPQASIRSQLTVDRSNLLPKLVADAHGDPVLEDINGDGIPDRPIVIENTGLPEIVAQRQIAYFNTQFDQ